MLLKQPQFSPLKMEEQVVVIYAASTAISTRFRSPSEAGFEGRHVCRCCGGKKECRHPHQPSATPRDSSDDHRAKAEDGLVVCGWSRVTPDFCVARRLL